MSGATDILGILQHALGRDQYGRSTSENRNHYCASEGSEFAACRVAVADGLMSERPPSVISGGDYVFIVTDAGKAYIAEHSPRPPTLTRAQRRYREFLRADSGLSFVEWLRWRQGAEVR